MHAAQGMPKTRHGPSQRGKPDQDSALRWQLGTPQTAPSVLLRVSDPLVLAAHVGEQACSPEHALQQVGPRQWKQHIKDHALPAETHLSQRLARYCASSGTPWQVRRCRVLHQRMGCTVQKPLQLAVCSTKWQVLAA